MSITTCFYFLFLLKKEDFFDIQKDGHRALTDRILHAVRKLNVKF